MRPSAHADRRNARGAGFTLLELILVLFLLALVASYVAPQMSTFFRGRTLNLEARRLLALTHQAQSRAVAEGVPVVLWIDPRTSRYGLEVGAGHATGDDRVSTFTADATVTFQVPASEPAATSESEDEKLGLPEGLPAIRFLPDGYFDEVSVRRIILQQAPDGRLELVQRGNRLGYEIITPAGP